MTAYPPEQMHSTPEDRIAASKTIATFEDLENLTQDQLVLIARECDLDADPEICVPCRAFAMWMDEETRIAEEAQHRLENPLEEDVPPGAQELTDGEIENLPVLPLQGETDGIATFDTPHELPETAPVEYPDVRAKFAAMVHDLNLVVTEMLEGPPIPPSNITVYELASLVLGSQNWVNHLDKVAAEGFTLPEDTARLKSAVEQTLAKVKR